jgi:hypothetical protein
MPATPSRQDPWLTGLFVLVLLAFLFGLLGLITDAGRGPPAATPTTQASPGAPVEAANARLRVPRPQPEELDEQAREVEVLAQGVIEGNDPAVVRGLSVMHEHSIQRQGEWRRQLEQARAAGVDTHGLSADAVVEDGIARRGQGWIALDQGDRAAALPLFAQALWADAEDADAWLGYALSTPSRAESIGALAVALVKYPDATTARLRREEYVPLAAHGDTKRQRDLDAVFVAATPLAERQRRRLPPALVRLYETLDWDGP